MIRWINSPSNGAYHRDLVQALARRGLTFAKVNPRQARRFAEAIGQDRQDRQGSLSRHCFAMHCRARDAAVLARMGVALQLEPTSALPEHIPELQELLVFRRGPIKDRTATQARPRTARPPLLRRFLAQRLAQIERRIGSVGGAMQTIVRADPDLGERMEILVSIPGISTVSATAILADMPELGRMSGKQAAALAGLAPMSRQSGRWQGRERIQGGRSSVRQCLCMPALGAIRHTRSVVSRGVV